MAFDLVAKLKLQDDFTNRLKRVGQQLDRLKNQVSKAASSTSDMGKKFSDASKIASKGLDKIKSNASKMQNTVGKAGNFSSKSLKSITTTAKDVGRKFTDLGSRSRDALSRIGNSASQLPSKFSGMGSKIKNSINTGIKGPASSARSAILGIASAVGVVAVASKGFQLLKGAIEGAVARYDTLNAFPKVMEKIGFSTDKSKKAIDRLVEGIDGLPTTLNEIAATTQRIAIMTGDLDKATETALALNNALIASGADADKAARGTEQYLKMLSTGKVNMDSWTTLQEVMGLGLNDLAKSFGITEGAIQDQLYNKLKDGKITFEQFNDKLIELSKAQDGFAEAALNSSGGLATAWKNISTAITNGVAGSITAIDQALGGTGKIENIIKKIKPVISQTFENANEKLGAFAKQMKKIYDATKPIHPILKEIAKAALVFGAVLGGMAMAAGAIAGIGALFAVIGSGVGIAILAVAGLVTGFMVAYQKIEPFRNAVQNLLGTFKEVFNVLKTGSGGGDLMKKMGFSDDQIQMARNFVDSIVETFGKVKESFKQLGDFLLQKKDELAPTLDLLAEAFSIGKNVLVDVFTTLWSVLQPIFGALKNAFMIVADIAVVAWTNIIAPALRFAMKNFQLLWTIVGPILKLLGSAIGVAFGVLKIVWDTILKPVVKFLSGIFTKTLEALNPKMDALKGKFEVFGGAIEKVAGWFDTFKSALAKFKVPNWLSKLGGGGTVKFEGGGGGDEKGEGRYHGIKYVPRDNKPYRLHRGEAVLTAKENKERQKGGGGGRPFIIQMNGTVIREEADLDRLADKMVRKFIAAGEGGA
ncbi:tape measure protein [Sporosarcina sp. FSL K6-3508]|uniref:tape measure protein n=1 Tax=Sporosarcina sp. FSL K6-3508 TaxID=2921557 RepID=UPI003159F760